MINKIKQKFSIKVFFITFILFIFVSGGTLFLIFKLIPSVYTNILSNHLNTMVNEALVNLSNKNDINDCIKILNELDDANNNVFWIYDEKGVSVYSSDGSIRKNMNYEDYFNTSNISEDSQSISQYAFTLTNGQQYTLTVETNLSEVTQVNDILVMLFPYVFLLDLLVSLICSLFYSRYITKPIVMLCEASQKMASFDFECIPVLKREDEIGVLSANLNVLSQALNSKINELNRINSQLEDDIDKKREIEHTRLAFFAATSHELKTPITILKGHLNGMHDQVGNYADRDKYLKRSIAVTNQMEVLIKELMFVAQINDKKTNIHFMEEDLAEIVRQELSNIISLIDEKEFVLNADLPEHMLCMVDRDLLHVILQNLMMNAIRYSPKYASINIQLIKEDNDDVSFMIENTGVFIPDASLDKLFDAFYKVDNARCSGNGTGLGLYIVRELLEKLNAKYRIYNTSDGVAFAFSIKKMEK